MNPLPNDGIAQTLTREPVLVALGIQVRLLRARCGMTRRDLARQASVSERYLANLEMGAGNSSILVLERLAQALGSTLINLLGDPLTRSAQGVQIRELLCDQPPATLQIVLDTLKQVLAAVPANPGRNRRIALVGLRGAGKSTLGRMLADELWVPFIEITSEVERIAGCAPSEIHALYGASAYHRYEYRALKEVLERHSGVVIASPCGLLPEARTLNFLLSHCFTVWLRATPEDHIKRVIGEAAPSLMQDTSEAISDLRTILASRSAHYDRADISYDTSGKTLAECYIGMRDLILTSTGEGTRQSRD